MRSDSLQRRLEVRSTVSQLLTDLMYQNQISATDMEEAIDHFLLSIKDQVMLEYAESAIQEKNDLQAQLQELNTPTEKEVETEEE